MTHSQHRDRLHDMLMTAGINSRYHQRCAWRCGVVDKAIKIAVLLVAGFGLIYSIPGPTGGLIVAFISFLLAGALNVLPVGDLAKGHGELFRLYCDVRNNILREQFKSNSADEDGAVQPLRVERLSELRDQLESLNALECAPYRRLLKDCEGDELESVYGVRTTEEVKKLTSSEAEAAAAMDQSAGVTVAAR